MTKEELIKHIENNFADDCEFTGCSIFNHSDVIACAEEMGVSITEDDAKRIIQTLDDEFDANDGINWDTIRSEITNYEY